MTLKPTDDQLKTLQSVEQSSAGIDAVSDKAGGFDCVINGWLEHRVLRREALTELAVVFRKRARQERSEVARRERLRPRQIPGHWSARQILGYLVLE